MGRAVWSIRDRATFVELRREGRRDRRGPVAVTFVPGSGEVHPRVAYSVDRRVGHAVARNRVRRRLRAVVAELDLAPGAYLVRAGAGAGAASHDDLAASAAEVVGVVTASNQRPEEGAT